MQIFFGLLGIIGIILFQLGISAPVFVSVAVLILAAGCLIRAFRYAMVGPISLVLFLVYVLPFAHIISYLGFNFDMSSPSQMWGLHVNPYMMDRRVVELMSMMGATGAAGFVMGALHGYGRSEIKATAPSAGPYGPCGKTLSLSIFSVWIFLAIVLTWVSSPEKTIFTAVYTQSKAINADWNFASAWMVSYCFLLFALVDSLFEQNKKIGRMKRLVVLVAFCLIVVWFQLLRGDRESLTCIFAAGLIIFVWGKGLLGTRGWIGKINGFVISMMVGLVFMISLLIGIMRSLLVHVRSVHDFWLMCVAVFYNGFMRPENLFCGTWSAVLLTPLSVAGDYIHGHLSFEAGRTYRDLLASVVPGFLAQWMGYVRPIDGTHGPALKMTYGMGGVHAVVVPFMNFRMAGVFIIIATWSFLFAKIEKMALSRLTPSLLALLGIVAMAAPHWLWYGEKNIMNALIIWLVLSMIYRMQTIRGGCDEYSDSKTS